MTVYAFTPPQPDDWPGIATLLTDSLPNALVSCFGRRFAALYWRHLAESPGARGIGVYDGAGTLAGIIIVTLDRQRTLRLPFSLKVQLLAAANVRLLSPAFLRWLVHSRRSTISREVAAVPRPPAELLAIAVDPRFRGERLAYRLLEQAEDFFRANGLRQPYLIHTELDNHAANKLYAQFGARFIGTNLHHGRSINEWHKTLSYPPSPLPATVE